jgi:hypothetical protein
VVLLFVEMAELKSRITKYNFHYVSILLSVRDPTSLAYGIAAVSSILAHETQVSCSHPTTKNYFTYVK